MESEDIYTFYREEIDPEFAIIWTKVVENADSCDVRLECIDGQYCHSHQSLLAISSQCFFDAFRWFHTNCELPSNEELVINLPNIVSYDVLIAIIQYINDGFVSIAESQVLNFLEVSKFLAVKGLQDIQLVYLNEMEDIDQNVTSNQFKNKYKYVIELKNSDHINDSSEDSSDEMNGLSSEDSLDSYFKYDNFTPLDALITYGKGLAPKITSLLKKPSKKSSAIRRIGVQGRRPQIGSPLITEEFKCNDRYQCKVCFRSYLWKKSLVRHYRDLHPNNVQKVTQ